MTAPDDRATILSALEEARGGLTMNALAKRTGLPLSDVRTQVALLQRERQVRVAEGLVLPAHDSLLLQRDVLAVVTQRPDLTPLELGSRLARPLREVRPALDALEQQGLIRRFGGRVRLVPAQPSTLAAFAQAASPKDIAERRLKRVAQCVTDDHPEGASVGDVAATLSIPQREARDALAELINQGRLTCRSGHYYPLRRERELRESEERAQLSRLLNALGVTTR